ncbi:Transglutaminase-activating metalloprotease [Xanthomonas hydrangeae]|uniref:M4 family metallopeptidase n=1 Tax=Xanthomonas hydrangeae TaxID=2775159 RepID=UPI00196267DE|nr:Transglutaminase-activating metalloprotease [Xanthomonas hydrangeae]CAD7713264.1 Transglutaminase-activating metalloprotease [Xanthomonas hydrangeae]CAD7719149.1 Transglutaminase-activating metalloprotease [Xanthomonas hydrangeae]CAD7719152.1 Transglutaminase-activating metalloprotease [Xanthomonas hydrangeae]CAD7723363.1 Transglutaminase-activating metalloprotease [Xanthomonas hydrangeae]
MQFHVLGAAICCALSLSAVASAADLSADAAVARAQSLLGNNAAALANRAAADTFVARDSIVDADGTEHVRFDRTYQGLPVIGGDVVVHSRRGVMRQLSQTMDTNVRPAIVPGIDADTAMRAAGAQFDVEQDAAPRASLALYARQGAPRLVYEVIYSGIKPDQTPTEMHYIVDAVNQRILDSWDTVHTVCSGGTSATGTGRSLYAGNVGLSTTRCSSGYELTDLSRGSGATYNMRNSTSGNGTLVTDADNAWGSGANSDTVTAAVDAHYGVALTWDYFRTAHARSGIANDGAGARSRVHYGSRYNNAFWQDSCFCMTFGDGDGSTFTPLVSVDVAGHEMTHGVTSRTARLVYSGESGGLNEATSDIMGAMVEYSANNSAQPGNYLIGEKIVPGNSSGTLALRYMFKPSLDGDSPDCYSSSLGSLNVHYSSGVANHFYYLLAEGAVVPSGFGAGTSWNVTPAGLVCNGNTALTSIGRAAASRIWYRALTVYMTSSTNYAAARRATLSAATDLYGSTSTQYRAVAAAWSAVSVN